ncbi:MAG: LysM peptidoglycan-binding domain-containing protein [Acidobacteriia bacterium]|nr:LysM peptidoglycan-binding domain-containing protein [Terriglobia bacterium]
MTADFSFTNFEEHKVKTGESLDSIAKKHGITWEQLSQFNWETSEPKQINECLHEFVGCRQKTKDRNNYIFTSKDNPGIIYVPVKSPHYKLATGKTHRIQVIRPHLKSDIEVETVDDFLHVVPNVTVVLKRKEGGPDVEIATDESGYGVAKRVLSGHYKVTVKGGGPAYFLVRTNQPLNDDPNADIGEFEEAVIDTRQRVQALTQLVVARIATPTEKRERRLLQRVYTRTQKQEAKGRGTETSTAESKTYARLNQTRAVDNLALLAGWKDNGDVDIPNLVSSILPDFFQDRDGAPSNRKYYVWVMESTAQSPRVSAYNASGAVEATFKLPRPPSGLVGVYTPYENSAGALFVDMMTKSYSIGQEFDSVVPIEKLVSSGDEQKVLDTWNAHAEQDHVAVLYWLPTGGQLAWIGVHGGSGRLEDYGNQVAVNKRIHARNIAVCRRISELYNAYIEGYRARVKKTRNEKELRKLGPPWAPYIMPTPAKATDDQLWDIFDAYSLNQLRAWSAVCEQLDKFAGRMSEGSPYISLKAKYEVGGRGEGGEGGEAALEKLAKGGTALDEPLPVSVEVEGSLTFQFTDDEIRMLTGHEEKGKVSAEGELKLKGGKYNLGLEYKRNLKKPEEWEVTIKTGPLELEANKDGTRKIAIEALPEIWAESQFNPNQATFEGGLKIETEVILDIFKKIPVKNKGLHEFFEKYGEKIVPKEISVHAGLVGLKERTALAVITNAPGFFQRRDLDELVELQWNALDLDEQVHLTQLGWDQCSWDLKSYVGAEVPKTMEEEWEAFSPQQQIATLHLGFYDAEDYHERIEHSRTKKAGWKDAIEKLQCAGKAGKEGEESASTSHSE